LTSPISGLSGLSGTAATGATPAAPAKTLDENAFLKLLVAQLKYQDPSKPVDANQMMSQTATFTQVEKLSALVTAQQSLVSAQHMQTASAMVGRTVAYTTSDGHTGTGVVASATLTGSEPTLKVGNKDVPLSSVTEVRSSAG
jgi:flagellar basal-body rod modification protein FlgD